MKFKLVICEEEEEQVVAMVHKPSALTQKIEQLVLQYAGNDKLAVSNEDELLMLPYANIECITVLDGKTYAINTAGKHGDSYTSALNSSPMSLGINALSHSADCYNPVFGKTSANTSGYNLALVGWSAAARNRNTCHIV